jgi:16S rRNA U516 pseudouridylate synthase RsuA-like enzyme
MTAAVGFPTLRLIRIQIGTIRLEIKAEEVMETETLL